LYFHHLRL
jgi:hypothetical protein